MTKLTIAMIAALAGCASTRAEVRATSPQLQAEHDANVTLGAMRARDPAIDKVLNTAYAYAVFPDVGKPGVLFENGRMAGYVRLDRHPGDTFSELLVLRDRRDVDQMKIGVYDLARGTATVFVMPHGSNRVELSARDQRIQYDPNAG
jgi:hypothetical protein